VSYFSVPEKNDKNASISGEEVEVDDDPNPVLEIEFKFVFFVPSHSKRTSQKRN